MFSLRLGSVSSLRAERRPVLVSSRRHLALVVDQLSTRWLGNAGKSRGDFQRDLKVTNCCCEGFIGADPAGNWFVAFAGCESGGCYHMTHTLSNCGAWVVPGPLGNMVNNFISKMEIHHF